MIFMISRQCTPFDDYLGKYNKNEIFGYTVKVSEIPDNYPVKNLISNKQKPDYLHPLFAYIADHGLCSEINWHDDRYKARILTDEEVQNIEADTYWLEAVINLNFDDIMNYYSELR
ncbi:MAG: hypothetical protein [Wendovervirus sonii]|uniref:Phage protein n=1 Tax=phage Lak_Megaphage_Sonny TaxID=3109229 RepID=A0ABZ0Z253_9CAUD|nr:MAG: hypothetical protein [phage Lak_Megaphage_Sonny]